ncbi:MAG: hypothetical protein MJB14_10565 [Spirochaetes bacterium]|nr:hypothetical protein [Spirochaetota bacterium]
MIQFEFIDARTILQESFALGKKVYESGFIPTHAISLWRGGTPVGLGVGEFFRLKGHFINHTTVATASYTGINSQSEVIIKGLEHLIKVIAKEDNLLIIDDIYDSGDTIEAIIAAIKESARSNTPENIRVACIHNKIKKRNYHHQVTTLRDFAENIWINYPHEISDLVMADDPDEEILKRKSPTVQKIINQTKAFPIETMKSNKNSFIYITPQKLLEDAVKLAVNIFCDHFYPDFIIATWPGGVNAGIPIHEYFKYRKIKEGLDFKTPDHIAINTSLSHYSYKSNIIGMKYLEEKINEDDQILLVDTVFNSGRLINQTIDKLKKILRRNITVENIRIASIYYQPKPDFTLTNKLFFDTPHYYMIQPETDIIFPHQIHRLPNPEITLKEIDPEFHEILYG